MLYMKPAFISKPKDDIERFINAFLLDVLDLKRNETIKDLAARATSIQIMFATTRSCYFAHIIKEFTGEGSVGFLLPSFEAVYVDPNGNFYTVDGLTDVKKGKKVYCLMEDKTHPDIIAWAKHNSNTFSNVAVPVETVIKNCEEAFAIPKEKFGFLFHALSGHEGGV
ncbi:MAG: hypothetical protein J6Y02_23420 [Pseudobutyrivibrio sp.]|nr:hypothetical protein [Pseudobutyrivibrio sp.]